MHAYINDPAPQTESELHIHSAVTYFPATQEKLEEHRKSCMSDPTLTKLRSFVCNVWPKHKGNLPLDLYAYWPIQEQIHEDGILLVENMVIIHTQCIQSNIRVVFVLVGSSYGMACAVQ